MSFLGLGSIFGGSNNADFQASGVPENQNVDYGIQQQQNFLGALNGLNGVGNQNNVFGQQQGLANQLQTQAMGGGPNPAAAQLAQNTGQNIQQQAALMNSARGANSNPGLIARQAAQQGANIQQQSVGQAATMRANQQLAAQQALQQQQGMMGNLATAQIGQQQQGLGLFNQMAQGQNGQNIAMQSNINNANAGIAQQNASTQGKILGGVLQGAAFNLNSGGMVPEQHFDNGGISQPTPQSILAQYSQGLNFPNSGTQPQLFNGKPIQEENLDLSKRKSSPQGTDDAPAQFDADNSSLGGSTIGESLGGPGAEEAGGSSTAELGPLLALTASGGGKVPGKSKVSGDSLQNDTVNAKLSPGEIVIPRTHSHDPKKIAQFLNSLLGINLRVGNV